MVVRRKQAGLEQLGPEVMGLRQLGMMVPTESITYPLAMLPAAKPAAAAARDFVARNAATAGNTAARGTRNAVQFAKALPPSFQALSRISGVRARALLDWLLRMRK